MADTLTAQQHRSRGALPRCRSLVGSSVYLCAFSHSLFRTCSKNVTFDCYLFLFLEELCLELARAIEAGDTQAASQHASTLARQKAVLRIQMSEKNYAEGEIR